MGVQIDDLTPLLVAACFYTTVFALAHVSRNLVRRYLGHWTSQSRFLLEAITTAQMCTCVYENGVVTRNYGIWGFFFVVSMVLVAGANLNGGGYVSPLVPFELHYNQGISSQTLLELISAQAIGGYSAFRIARGLWYLTSNLSVEHLISFEDNKCAFIYKVPFSVAFAFEIVGCFLLRFLLARVPLRLKCYLEPVISTAFSAFALAFIGVNNLDPTVAASRMFGCDGLSTLWFVAIYWICPIIGWMICCHL